MNPVKTRTNETLGTLLTATEEPKLKLWKQKLILFYSALNANLVEAERH